MTKVIQKGDPFRANPVPRWVGIWVCKQCGTVTDIGEDYAPWAEQWNQPSGSQNAPWTPTMEAACPRCRREMRKEEFCEACPSAEREKAVFRRRYPTVWSRMKARWFGWID